MIHNIVCRIVNKANEGSFAYFKRPIQEEISVSKDVKLNFLYKRVYDD